ncbi:hypothetical protein ACH5RR_009269 [Cinchona calisaya]|uniref:Retrotransposon gag domain-containing protein n=1 Tax=Cinchona calisaya TaxID=153742 RepID=A0ABD3ADY4_9GENT
MGTISNVRFIGPISSHQPFSQNWPKVVPQPLEESFVLDLLDSPPSQNLTTNHHVVKDPTTSEMDFESLCLFPDVRKDEHLRICLFQRSSCGDAHQWFIRLNRSELQSWNGFIKAFLDKFQLGNESIPDGIDLMGFIRTIEELFHEKLLGFVNHRFFEVVEQGEMIEQGINYGNFADVSVPKVLWKGETKGKEKTDRGSTVIK